MLSIKRFMFSFVFILLFSLFGITHIFAEVTVLDTSFSGDGMLTSDIGYPGNVYINDIERQSDGKILAVGNGVNTISPADNDFILWRYNLDGSLDTSFNGIGYVVWDYGDRDTPYSVKVQSDGKIVVVGGYSSGLWSMCIWRYNSNGTLDTSFGGGSGKFIHSNAAGGVGVDAGNILIENDDGSIYIGGYSTNSNGNYDGVIWKITQNGVLDSSYNSLGYKILTSIDGSTGNNAVNDLSFHNDGSLLATGYVTVPLYPVDMALWKINTDGSLDLGFNGVGYITINNVAGGNGNDNATSLIVFEGNYYLGGSSIVDSYYDSAIVKLLSKYQISNLDSELDAQVSGTSVKLGSTDGGLGEESVVIMFNGYPLASTEATFEEELDWGDLTGDIDFINSKSVIDNLDPINSSGASTTHSLYIPKNSGMEAVFICPNATNLEEVYIGCSEGYTLFDISTNVSVEIVAERPYFKVNNLEGTGGLGYSLSGVNLSLTPNSTLVSTKHEVQMSFISPSSYLQNDKVIFTYESEGNFVLSNDCVSPTTDANGASEGGTGTASIIGNNVYEYTFSTTTPASTLTFCVNVTLQALRETFLFY